jgi:hypothetical protein
MKLIPFDPNSEFPCAPITYNNHLRTPTAHPILPTPNPCTASIPTPSTTMFGSSSSQTSTTPPPAPNRQERAACWASRDQYYACLDAQGVQSAEGEKGKACEGERKGYEGSCGRAWVSYGLRKGFLGGLSSGGLAREGGVGVEGAVQAEVRDRLGMVTEGAGMDTRRSTGRWLLQRMKRPG